MSSLSVFAVHHDDGQLGVEARLAHLRSTSSPRQARHHDVEQDEVDAAAAQDRRGPRRPLRRQHAEALALQPPRQQVAVVRVVVDDEDVCGLAHRRGARATGGQACR